MWAPCWMCAIFPGRQPMLRLPQSMNRDFLFPISKPCSLLGDTMKILVFWLKAISWTCLQGRGKLSTSSSNSADDSQLAPSLPHPHLPQNPTIVTLCINIWQRKTQPIFSQGKMTPYCTEANNLIEEISSQG